MRLSCVNLQHKYLKTVLVTSGDLYLLNVCQGCLRIGSCAPMFGASKLTACEQFLSATLKGPHHDIGRPTVLKPWSVMLNTDCYLYFTYTYTKRFS